MPTSARPHPSLNAMLLCDLTIREHGTGKMSLIGIFENISAARFPVVHRALTVYAKLADAEGEYGIRLELVRLGRQPHGGAGHRCAPASPIA